tara:strand:+ start:1837 stop:3423 length:1587 start_codon:yes stop_codon:yes gene_type:complete
VADNFINKLGAAFSGETAKESISKNIIKKVNPVLTSNEKRRLKNEATIFAETLVNVQEKSKPDTFGETKTVQDTPASKVSGMVQGEKNKPPKLPLLLALGAGIAAFAAWISDFLGPVGEFVSKTLPKILKPMGKFAGGFFKAMKGGKLMKMFGGIAKIIGPKLLKFGRFIPVVGSLFSFGFGIARWKEGDYMKAILEFLSGILNLLPFGVTNIASLLIDGYLLLSDLNETGEGEEEKIEGEGFSMWDKIKEFALNLPGIKNVIEMGKGYAAIFRGDFAAAAEHFRTGLGPIAGVIDFLANAAVKGGMGAAAFLEGQGIDLSSPGAFFQTITDKFVQMFKDTISSIFEFITEGVDNIVKGVKDFGGGLKDGALDFGKGALNLIPFVNLDDFMVRGDKIIPFNSEDDVMGMKEGGALAKMIKGGTSEDDVVGMGMKEVGALAKMIKGSTSEGVVVRDVFDRAVTSEIQKSNQYLAQLVQLTAKMVTGQGTPTPSTVVSQPSHNDSMQGDVSGPNYVDSRVKYNNSTYSLA